MSKRRDLLRRGSLGVPSETVEEDEFTVKASLRKGNGGIGFIDGVGREGGVGDEGEKGRNKTEKKNFFFKITTYKKKKILF